MININYYISEGLAKNKRQTTFKGMYRKIYYYTIYISKFIITNYRYNRYQISNKYYINGEMHVNYPSLLNLVQSVIIINAKYVD